MDEIQEKANILKRSEIFLGFDDVTLKKLAVPGICQKRVYNAKDVIFSVGDPAKELFIVVEGKVDLILIEPLPHHQTRAEALIDTIYTGGTFGWSSLIGPYNYSSMTICKEPTIVLAINGNALLSFLDQEKITGYEVIKAILKIVSLRLRDSNKSLLRIIASKSETP